MDKQLKFNFDSNSIEIKEKENNFYDWCIENNRNDLLNEWDYQKNGNITPKDVSFGADKKVWWIKHYCDPKTNKEFDFSWKASVSHRKSGRGCPYLSFPAKKIFIGFNDLSTTHPELASEWAKEKNEEEFGIKVTNFTYGSTKKVYWNCNIHGLYMAIISDRVHGNGCPFCSGKKVLVGFNDLKTLEPEIAAEWDYDKNEVGPESVTRCNNKKRWWKCTKCGHSWQATPNSRVGAKTGCPYCSNRKVIAGYNDLNTNNPKIASEWNYKKNESLTPQKVSAGSNRKVWWVCRFGHEYQMRIVSRTTEGIGCPICNFERKTSFPEKAIYYYIKQAFNESVENAKFEWLGKAEIDIFIPSIKVGIEYDGYHWHKDVEKDYKKDKLCNENGIDLIRIRTDGCPKYNSSSIKIEYGKNKAVVSLNDVIIELLKTL